MTRELQKELADKVLQEKQEKALLGQPDKRSARERDEDHEEQQDKAAQDKLENETLSGNIKIYQFDN